MQFPPHLSETKFPPSLVFCWASSTLLTPSFPPKPFSPLSLSLSKPLFLSLKPYFSPILIPFPSNFTPIWLGSSPMSTAAGPPDRRASPPRGPAGTPARPPLKRHLAFVTKPPFAPPDDYHSFSSIDSRRLADEAVVVRSPVSTSVSPLRSQIHLRGSRIGNVLFCVECDVEFTWWRSPSCFNVCVCVAILFSGSFPFP